MNTPKEGNQPADRTTVNNAFGLLEECLVNGDKGMLNLYAWFVDARNLIIQTTEKK